MAIDGLPEPPHSGGVDKLIYKLAANIMDSSGLKKIIGSVLDESGKSKDLFPMSIR